MFLSEFAFYTIMFVAIIVTIKSPLVGLVTYYAFSFLRPQDLYWWALSESRLSFYVAIATIFSAILHFNQTNRDVKRFNYFFLFFLVFLVLAFFSFFFSQDAEASYPWMILIAKLLIMGMITLLVVENVKQIKIIMIMLIVVFGYLAYWANDQYFFQGVWHIGSPGQPGTGGRLDNNGFAMQFVMVLPIVFFMFFTTKKPPFVRWIYMLLIPGIIHAIILTYSRGGFLGMIIVLGNCILYLKNKKWAIVLGIFVLLVTLRLQGQASKERISTVLEYEEDYSAMSRIHAWDAGFNMMREYPVFGIGIGNFSEYSPYFSDEFETPRAAHNAYIHIGGEMGVFAFFLFSFTLIFAFIVLIKIRRFYKPFIREHPHFYIATALFTSLIGYLICSMFLSLNYLELYYFIIALVGVMYNIYRRDRLKGEIADSS